MWRKMYCGFVDFLNEFRKKFTKKSSKEEQHENNEIKKETENDKESEDLKKSFLARRCISEKELNIDGKYFFNTKSGVIDLIKLKKLAEELGENFNGDTLIQNRKKWLFPHEDFKDNHFTCLAPITIPETFDEGKFYKDIDFLKKTLLKSLGGREDSYEWIMKNM